jgi:hypothetical protein|tara:strand:+ start:3245 stop:3724 length:480 start_codon:yes stop_codon:yes gene_type:complete
MGLLDKINPLKKKDDDFPHFDEKFGKSGGTSVPGPSADTDSAPVASLPTMGAAPPTPAPAQNDSRLNSIQISIQTITSTLQQMQRNLDNMSQRLGTIEGKVNANHPQQQSQTPAAPSGQVNPFNPQPQAQPQQGGVEQGQNEQQHRKTEEEDDGTGWHF